MQSKQEALEEAKILEKRLSDDPHNVGMMFRLAQSYEKAEEYDLAAQNFAKRAYSYVPGDELFLSFLGMARMEKFLGKSCDENFRSYCVAWENAPWTQEPLFWMAEYFMTGKMFTLAYLTAKYALALPRAPDRFVYDPSILEYRLLLAFATSAAQIGLLQEALQSWRLLLTLNIPAELRNVIEDNILKFGE